LACVVLCFSLLLGNELPSVMAPPHLGLNVNAVEEINTWVQLFRL
jgi:hypothetical protein